MATKQKLNKAVTAERAIAQMNSGNAAPDAMLRLQDGIQQMFRGYAQVFSALADLTGQPLVGSNPLVSMLLMKKMVKKLPAIISPRWCLRKWRSLMKSWSWRLRTELASAPRRSRRFSARCTVSLLKSQRTCVRTSMRSMLPVASAVSMMAAVTTMTLMRRIKVWQRNRN